MEQDLVSTLSDERDLGQSVRITETFMKGLHLLEPNVHDDDRGEFWRSFCAEELSLAGLSFQVCQSNVSVNRAAWTLRGLHRQRPPSDEAKILTVIMGSAHVVILDLRSGSDSRLRHEAIQIASGDRRSILVPSGCATGFLTMEPNTVVHYQMGDHFQPELYEGYRFDDPAFGIDWPSEPAVVSQRDATYPFFDLD